MKRTLIYAASLLIFASACQKENPLTGKDNSEATVSLTNVNASGKTLDFIIDGAKKSVNAPVGVNATILGTYVGINGDPSHAITVRDGANASLDYYIGSIAGTPSKGYSFFVYDTLVAGKLKALYLTANRNLSPGNVSTSNVRFLNFSPKSPALDCWVVRLTGAVRSDSVRVSAAAPYIGSTTPDVTALSNYTSVTANQAAGANGTGSVITTYSIKVTLANTNTIVTSAATTLVPGRNYTFYARGLYPSTALSLLTDN